LGNESRLKFEDLVRPLSLEALEYFLSDEIQVPHISYKEIGKFIRVGKVIVIALSEVQINGESVSHLDMSMIFERNPDWSKGFDNIIFADVEENNLGHGVSDAGFTGLLTDVQNKPKKLILSGESGYLGRSDDAGRQRTAEIAQAAVGESVKVKAIN
jgi:hypothetical protein